MNTRSLLVLSVLLPLSACPGDDTVPPVDTDGDTTGEPTTTNAPTTNTPTTNAPTTITRIP